ncbi:sigma-70 family RNA polymerase sigma factor [Urbifossiella limnaea]|uniref:ECF RNA polymerase sigma factor SigE n=1 Tax=Urbifossiella limnaea TaxID=2528023 RepID=A0A517Y037_9BACT|nr:sigma-70 family RNA polymerase sigma factor [Urbifossiella limnaea]QDU23129.1 ECF RNA polymerase sigma factor SigE [Urbifossiella limnaea]
MGTAQLGAVRRVFDRVRDDAGDDALLARYRAGRDDDAFGAIVRRHGPMVLGVCRRVLRDPHAAADAFQVTFLVLAKHAGRAPDLLGAWLYGVAVRTALKARGRDLRRREVEADYAARPLPAPPAADTELLRLIDAQVAELPEKYRLPLVLCGVQGLGKAEAADRLGLPEGTVSSRLARARDLLRGRLERRVVVVPALLLPAVVPPALSAATIDSAVWAAPVPAPVLALSQEVLAAMSAPAWKLPAAVVAAFAVSAGAVGLTGAQPPNPADKAPAAKQKDKPARPAGARVAGTLGAVDAGAGTITLARKNEADLIVPLAKDVAVTADGKAARLGDLKAGATVEVERASEKGPATRIAATGRRVTSLLVGVGDNTLSLKAKPNDQEYTLAAGAKVTRDGKDVRLKELPVGEPVTVQLSVDGTAVLGVSHGAAKRKPDGGEADEAEFVAAQDGEKRPARVARQTGTVGAVDAAAGTITLVRKGDGGERRDTIPVAKDATIIVDGKAAKLADVMVKASADVELPGERQPATKVTVSGEKVPGVLMAFDKDSVTVGFRRDGRALAERKLALAPAAKVTLDGKDAKLFDLQTGDRVIVTLTSDGTAALTIVAGVPKRDGDRQRPPEVERK